MANPEAQKDNPTSTLPIEIIGPDELAKRLLVKKSWIFEQTRRRADVRNSLPMPFFKLGLYLRFDWNEILIWIEKLKRKAY